MITLTGLTKEFAGTTALRGIDLQVDAGLIHGIVGRSGAGKSTLIRCLTGLERPTSGTVEIDGVDVTELRGAALRRARRNIGMVFQHAELLSAKTALQNIAHPLLVAGVPKKEAFAKAESLLERVGLEGRGDSYPAQLSGGQRQRVGIARALAADPQILLCDEPTSALDSTTTAQILGLIRQLRDELGITVLIITHEMSVVREICDSVTLLAEGKNMKTGRLRDILADPSSPLAKDLSPLPSVPLTQEGQERRTLEVSLAGTSAAELFALAESAGAPVAEVQAGTLETIDGLEVGRLRVRGADDAATVCLGKALTDAGIYCKEAR